MNKLNLKVGILPEYIIEYNYDKGWCAQFLTCPFFALTSNAGYVPEGAPLTLIDIEKNTVCIGVMHNSNLIGLLPKEILNDYIDRGFLRTNANYCVANNKKSVIFTLQN